MWRTGTNARFGKCEHSSGNGVVLAGAIIVMTPIHSYSYFSISLEQPMVVPTAVAVHMRFELRLQLSCQANSQATLHWLRPHRQQLRGVTITERT